MSFETVQSALQHIRSGRMVILVDDEDRENEGDLCMAAELVSAEAINFMAKNGRGLICLALTDDRISQLGLPMMVSENTSQFETAFTVTIEARHGVTTGISAADRATTIHAAVAPDAKPDDLVRPGHVFPLRARPGGVLVRTGQTEGAVDLARLAGLGPAGVICEVMNDDGTMARMPDLEKFAAEHDLLIVTIADLIEYRLANESLVKQLASQEVIHPQWGNVTLLAYGTNVDARQHLVVVKGDVTGDPPPLVRVHSSYPLRTVFDDLFSNECQVLDAAMGHLASEERGVLLCIDRGEAVEPLDERIRLLGQPGDGEPAGQPEGILREIGVGAQILRHLGLHSVRLLTNNPKRLAGIEAYGLKIADAVPLGVGRGLPRPQPKPKLEIVGAERD